MSAQNGNALPFILGAVAVLAIGGFIFFQQKNSSNPVTSPLSSNNSSDSSSDQIGFEAGEKKLLLSGGFADASVIKFKGSYMMYVNKFGAGGSANYIYTSKDGVNWQAIGKTVPGGPTARAFVIGDKVRLYYPTQVPINPSDAPSQMLSAISDDGISFTKELGVRLNPSKGYIIEGPSLIKTASGYRMYFSEFKSDKPQERRDGKIYGANSSDGLSWTRDTKPSIETDKVENAPSNWPQAIRPFVLPRSDGGFVMFYNTHSKIYSAFSEDGQSWQKLGSLGLKGADTDGYYQEDGKIRLYFGDFSEATSGVVYTTTLTEVKGKPMVIEEAPTDQVKPLGDSKPAAPPECVGKSKDDPNLSSTCQMWFKIE